MKKFILPILAVFAFIAAGVYGKILSDRCDELREKQARQEIILLKQTEILAVNTAMLQVLVSSLSQKNKQDTTGKEGPRMVVMP